MVAIRYQNPLVQPGFISTPIDLDPLANTPMENR